MAKVLVSAILILLFAIAATAAADTLLGYEQRVQRASEIARRIKARPTNAAELADDIETLLPKSEQVEFSGHTIYVDNSWLHTILESYKRRPNADTSTAQLDELRTKLSALDDQLVKLENQPGDQSKAENGRDALNRILSRSEFQERKDDFVTAAYKRVREAVIRLGQRVLAALFKLVFGERGEAGWLFRGFVIFVVLVFLAVAIYMIVKRRPVRRKARLARQIILDEEIGPNTNSKDLLNDALTAYRNGEFRLGIRRLYIALLYEMGERGIIELDRHATNNDYLKKTAGFAPLAGPMRYMTERFDYFWYGRFPASKEDFSAYKATFDLATQAVESQSSQRNSAQPSIHR